MVFLVLLVSMLVQMGFSKNPLSQTGGMIQKRN